MNEPIVLQRKFPRAFSMSFLRETPFLEEVETIWPNGISTGVYEFGRTVASVYLPLRLNLNLFKGDHIRLGFRFGRGQEAIYFDTRVIRSETRFLTVEFVRMDAKVLSTVRGLMTFDYISKNMRIVDPHLFAPEQTFDFWAHGPLDTNLYIWIKNKEVTRILLETEGALFQWTKKGFERSEARDSLSYATEDYAYYSHTLATFQPIDPKSQWALDFRFFVSRLISTHPAIRFASEALAG